MGSYAGRRIFAVIVAGNNFVSGPIGIRLFSSPFRFHFFFGVGNRRNRCAPLACPALSSLESVDAVGVKGCTFDLNALDIIVNSIFFQVWFYGR